MRTPLVRISLIAAASAVFLASLLGTATSATNADVDRYFAYCNATLGRPFDSYYVRTADAWRRHFISSPDANRARHDNVVPGSRLVPYRDFLVEYPPGFFLAVMPPAAVVTSETGYELLFEGWMIAWIVASLALCARIARYVEATVRVRELVLWMALSGVALGRVTIQRYDPMVAALLCLMCWATLARRPVALGLSAGAAIAAKIAPGVAALLCALYLYRQRRIRELGLASMVTVLTVAAICVPVALAAGTSGLSSVLQYHRDRPLEFESTAASLLGLWHAFDPSSAAVIDAYGSTNLVGRFAGAGLLTSVLACVLAIGWLFLRAWPAFAPWQRPSDGARGLLTATVAMLAMIIAFWKVASLQYLWWLVPLGVLACLTEDDWGSMALLVVALMLAQIVFPLAWGAAQSLHAWPYALILGRNLILVVWAGRLVRRSTCSAQRP
jgi:hypothetical protein